MPLSVENEAITGADGVGEVGWVGDEIASTVTARGADATLVLPAASASVAVKLCPPTVKLLAVKFQAPFPFTEAVPRDFVPSNTCTVLFASPVPAKVSVVAVVWPSLVGDVSGENEDIFGCAGATVSIVTEKTDDGALVDPAAFVSVAVKLCFPSGNASGCIAPSAA